MIKNINKLIFLLVAVIGICLAGCTEEPEVTTGTISGTVSLGPVGVEPLEGVLVTLSPTGLTQVTDHGGGYRFSDLTAGNYTLQFSKQGYNTASRSISVKAKDVLTADITLQPIEEIADIELSTSSLIFDKGVNELILSIRNTGSAANCDWTISGITVDWLSITPRTGSTRKGSTSTVKVMVDRSLLSSTGIVSTTFHVVGKNFSLGVYVEVTNNSGGGNESETYGSIMGRVVDSSTYLPISDATITLSPGFLTAKTNSNGVFSYNDLKPGSYSVEAVAEGYSVGKTDIVVNGGASSSVTINLVKKESGSQGGGDDDPTPTPEDYSKAKITSCDSRVQAKITSCKRFGSSVTFEYTLTNNGLGNVNDWRIYPPKSMSLINGGTRSSVWTSDGTEYPYPSMTFRGETTTGSNIINTSFPMQVPCSGKVTISNVSSSAKEFNLILGVYAYPNSTYQMTSSAISFLNVPIY